MLERSLKSVKSNSFLIEIFGLGYVGFPLAVKLASSGYKIKGIDIDPQRRERLQKGQLMDLELYLENEFLECVKNKNFEITNEPVSSKMTKVGIICVPTPIPNKDTSSDVFLKSAVETFLNFSNSGDIIILESSIEVGTTEKIKDVIEAKGFKVGKD